MTTEPEGIACEMHVAADGLPRRGELLLARERQQWAGMVQSLFSLDKGEGAGGGELTTAVIQRELGSTEPVRPYSAAFLAGRCRAAKADADQRLTARLISILDAGAAAGADVRIEVAMSAALRGNTQRADQALRAALASPDPLGDQYKAAFYLAQLGDPAGWPALTRTLQGEIAHYRLMALRHAAAFLPYDGTTVGGEKVDVGAALAGRLADPDSLVRQEVPFYLEEMRHPDLRRLLQPIASGDASPEVRAAAQMVLDRNR